MFNRLNKFILLSGDIAWLYLALYLTLIIRYQALPNAENWNRHLWPFTLIFLIWVIIFYISNLYNLRLAVNDTRFLASTARALFIAGLLAALFFYINPRIGIAPKTNLLIYLAVFAVLFLLWRGFFNWLVKSYLPKERVAIIGDNEMIRELAVFLKDRPQLGYEIALSISEQETSDLSVLMAKNKISTIVLASDLNRSDVLRASLFNCLPLKINFYSYINFYEIVQGKVPITTIGQAWFLENLNEGRKSLFDLVKRIYDFIFALTIFIVSLPGWPLIGLVIKLESRGPVFFRQARTGKNNIIFKIIKFRTMREENNDHAPTRAKDSRVTKFGSFLRKSRLDELPQLLNILAGQMSFVGPRPERPEIVAELEKILPFYRERTLVKPGLTGWDQISGEYHSPSPEDTLKKLQYDLFYIKNRSLYLDLSIILKTIATVVSREGV